MKSNGPAIRDLRQRAGYTLTKFAHITGIDRSHLGRIEKGQRNGTPEQLVNVAKHLDVPLDAVAEL